MAKYALAGYYRTDELMPGEEKDVTVHINERSLSYWNTDGELQEQSDGTTGKWKVAEGTRVVYVGASSDNLLLEQTVDVTAESSNGSDDSNGSNSSGSSGSSSAVTGSVAGSWKQDSNGWWYSYAKGGYASGKWEQIQNQWYYFDTVNCNMVTGWLELNENWYYFNESTANQATYTFNEEKGTWVYSNDSAIPYGAMYANRETPDGYYVNSNGERSN